MYTIYRRIDQGLQEREYSLPLDNMQVSNLQTYKSEITSLMTV